MTLYNLWISAINYNETGFRRRTREVLCSFAFSIACKIIDRKQRNFHAKRMQ